MNIMTLNLLRRTQCRKVIWQRWMVTISRRHSDADEARAHKGQPTAIICETTKGKASFMENNPD